MVPWSTRGPPRRLANRPPHYNRTPLNFYDLSFVRVRDTPAPLSCSVERYFCVRRRGRRRGRPLRFSLDLHSGVHIEYFSFRGPFRPSAFCPIRQIKRGGSADHPLEVTRGRGWLARRPGRGSRVTYAPLPDRDRPVGTSVQRHHRRQTTAAPQGRVSFMPRQIGSVDTRE